MNQSFALRLPSTKSLRLSKKRDSLLSPGFFALAAASLTSTAYAAHTYAPAVASFLWTHGAAGLLGMAATAAVPVTMLWLAGAAIVTGIVLVTEFMTRRIDSKALKEREELIANFDNYDPSDKGDVGAYARSRYAEQHPYFLDDVKGLWEAAGKNSKRLRIIIAPGDYMSLNAMSFNPHDKETVVVSESLMQILNRRELRGVLAHELSHLRDEHYKTGKLLHRLGISAFFGIFLAVNSLLGAGALVFLYGARKPVMELIRASATREFERMADRDGALLSHDPYALASALRKMTAIIKDETGEDPSRGSILQDHPGTADRVVALVKLAARMRAAGMEVYRPGSDMDLPENSSIPTPVPVQGEQRRRVAGMGGRRFSDVVFA
jgi:heat shock protein HtpX